MECPASYVQTSLASRLRPSTPMPDILAVAVAEAQRLIGATRVLS